MTDNQNTERLSWNSPMHLTHCSRAEGYPEARRGDDFPGDTAGPELRSPARPGPLCAPAAPHPAAVRRCPLLSPKQERAAWGRESEGGPGQWSHRAPRSPVPHRGLAGTSAHPHGEQTNRLSAAGPVSWTGETEAVGQDCVCMEQGCYLLMENNCPVQTEFSCPLEIQR